MFQIQVLQLKCSLVFWFFWFIQWFQLFLLRMLAVSYNLNISQVFYFLNEKLFFDNLMNHFLFCHCYIVGIRHADINLCVLYRSSLCWQIFKKGIPALARMVRSLHLPSVQMWDQRWKIFHRCCWVKLNSECLLFLHLFWIIYWCSYITVAENQKYLKTP